EARFFLSSGMADRSLETGFTGVRQAYSAFQPHSATLASFRLGSDRARRGRIWNQRPSPVPAVRKLARPGRNLSPARVDEGDRPRLARDHRPGARARAGPRA